MIITVREEHDEADKTTKCNVFAANFPVIYYNDNSLNVSRSDKPAVTYSRLTCIYNKPPITLQRLTPVYKMSHIHFGVHLLMFMTNLWYYMLTYPRSLHISNSMVWTYPYL